jgi:hypothetical protein
MQTQNNNKTILLREYMFVGNRTFLLTIGILMIVIFAGYKIIFPFPTLTPDSHTYLVMAYNNQLVGAFPGGYGKFLRLFSAFTSSALMLTMFQYIYLQFCTIYFLFRIAYLFKFSVWVTRLLITLSVVNPIIILSSNLITPDALFAGVSIIWFSQLLEIRYKPTLGMLLSHAMTALVAFSLKYNALYYPLISLLVIIFSDLRFRSKAIGFGMVVLLLGGFIGATQVEYEKSTGWNQFAPSIGWQLAGNILTAYEQFPENKNVQFPKRFAELNKLVTQHVDSLNDVAKYLHSKLSYFYQYDKSSPLYAYMNKAWTFDTTGSKIKHWSRMGPTYMEYGIMLIQNHPEAYIKHFVKPNLNYFFTPNAEVLGYYNLSGKTVDSLARTWFNLKISKAYNNNTDIPGSDYFSIPVAIANTVFMLGFIAFCYLNGFKAVNRFAGTALKLALLFWCCNFLFSIISAPIMLRYQIFPFVLAYSFATFLFVFVIQKCFPRKKQYYCLQPDFV